MASEELEQSLREQIDGFIRARLGEVQEQISQIQNEINDAFGRINDLQRKGESVDQSLSDAISEHLQTARESGMALLGPNTVGMVNALVGAAVTFMDITPVPPPAPRAIG